MSVGVITNFRLLFKSLFGFKLNPIFTMLPCWPQGRNSRSSILHLFLMMNCHLLGIEVWVGRGRWLLYKCHGRLVVILLNSEILILSAALCCVLNNVFFFIFVYLMFKFVVPENVLYLSFRWHMRCKQMWIGLWKLLWNIWGFSSWKYKWWT